MLPVNQMWVSIMRCMQHPVHPALYVSALRLLQTTTAKVPLSYQGSRSASEARQKQSGSETPTIIPDTEGWSFKTATLSEVAVKADHARDMPIDQLQRFTAAAISKCGCSSTSSPSTKSD